MLKRSTSLLLAAFCLLGAGCNTTGTKERLRPAPSSSMPRADWSRSGVVGAWVRSRPGNVWATVLPTGSMAPYVDSKSLLLIEAVVSKDLIPGDVAIYRGRGDARVVHTVRAVNARGAVLFSGDNNAGLEYDGWVPADRILGRVAGTLNTNGR